MDGKTLKFYETMMKYTDADFYLRTEQSQNFVQDMHKLGLDHGLDACYYLFHKHEKLFDYKTISEAVMVTCFSALLAENRAKVVRTVLASPVLVRGFFTLNERVYSGETLDILVTFLEGAKVAEADTLLKAIFKNERVSFGAGMQTIIETYFARLMEKQNTKKPELPKKLVPLLQDYIGKIKTEEKFLLTQRLKEVL